LSLFERIARRAHLFSDEEVRLDSIDHPFDVRNIHPAIPGHVKNLFDDGYYPQATFEAFKYLDKQVARIAKSSLTGYKLMMAAFDDQKPMMQLTPLSNDSDRDEQRGFQFIFAGSIMAIRNPRGHEYKINDNIDDCLDYLSLVSLLLRRIEKAGFRLKT
ncbi:MAG: TIGR02391 family protein, partial [Desulfobacteraceae bacterium]|nr:TIGR02391 family protein [Desulfobacteraceae bacterium]